MFYVRCALCEKVHVQWQVRDHQFCSDIKIMFLFAPQFYVIIWFNSIPFMSFNGPHYPTFFKHGPFMNECKYHCGITLQIPDYFRYCMITYLCKY